jgi:hypothetical protein
VRPPATALALGLVLALAATAHAKPVIVALGDGPKRSWRRAPSKNAMVCPKQSSARR